MKLLPTTKEPLLIRTGFENQQVWETIVKQVLAPVHEGPDTFHAIVDLLDDSEFRNLSKEALLARVPQDYNHSFLLVIDSAAIGDPEHAVLIIDLFTEYGRSFRALPSEIQAIENNLSIANMDFFEFADAVDKDGVFRGFRKP